MKKKRIGTHNNQPIWVNGIRYNSIFEASIETEITYKTLWFKIQERNGAPTLTKGQKIFSEKWFLKNKNYMEVKNKMSDTNMVVLEGRLTKSAELKNTGKSSVCNFSIANNQSYKEDGLWKSKANFIDCEIWGKLADAMYPHLIKGIKLTVVGNIIQQSWKDRNNESHSKIKVCVSDISIQWDKKEKSGSTDFPPPDKESPYDN